MLQARVKDASAASGVSLRRMETMGSRIRALRLSKGWTQKELADRLARRGAKVSANAISQWERDETANIKLATFLALVEVLGTTHEFLVHGPSDPSDRDSTGRFRRLRRSSDSGSKS